MKSHRKMQTLNEAHFPSRNGLCCCFVTCSGSYGSALDPVISHGPNRSRAVLKTLCSLVKAQFVFPDVCAPAARGTFHATVTLYYSCKSHISILKGLLNKQTNKTKQKVLACPDLQKETKCCIGPAGESTGVAGAWY